MKNEMRCVGFDIKNKKEFEELALKSIESYDVKNVYTSHDKKNKVQKIKYFGNDFGILTMSEVDSKGNTVINVIQPYYETSFTQRVKNVEIKQVDKDIFIGFGVEECSNVMILFAIQNDCVELYEEQNSLTGDKDVKLYAVSCDSKVLIPNQPKIVEPKELIDSMLEISDNPMLNLLEVFNLTEEELNQKIEMLEQLLLADMNAQKSNTFTKKQEEEELSISNIFEKLKEYIHYIGRNTYEYLGTIQSIETSVNTKTGIKIYIIVLEISGVFLDILINEIDLYGSPTVGMRLHGTFKFCGQVLKDNC